MLRLYVILYSEVSSNKLKGRGMSIMNFWVILVEVVVLTLLFTIGVVAGSKDPVDTVYDMPEPIINRCLELGLIDESKKATSPQTIKKKLCAAVIITIILALVLYFVNHADSFAQGFLVSYLIWLIIDWYDCFVIDWIWVCHSKKLIIPGTEDLVDSYKDYKFHFIGSLKGMVIGLPVCLLVGVMVQIVNWVI